MRLLDYIHYVLLLTFWGMSISPFPQVSNKIKVLEWRGDWDEPVKQRYENTRKIAWVNIWKFSTQPSSQWNWAARATTGKPKPEKPSSLFCSSMKPMKGLRKKKVAFLIDWPHRPACEHMTHKLLFQPDNRWFLRKETQWKVGGGRTVQSSHLEKCWLKNMFNSITTCQNTPHGKIETGMQMSAVRNHC